MAAVFKDGRHADYIDYLLVGVFAQRVGRITYADAKDCRFVEAVLSVRGSNREGRPRSEGQLHMTPGPQGGWRAREDSNL